MRKTKHSVLLMLCLLFLTAGFGQSVEDIVQRTTHYFTITKGNSLSGDGAELIKKRISES